MSQATRLRTGPEARGDGKRVMEREIIRVEPFDSNFEKWGAPVDLQFCPGHGCSARNPIAATSFLIT
jgi:hypothetical protein